MEQLVIMGISLLLILFFSGSGVAWQYADKLRLELEMKGGSVLYGTLNRVTRNQELFNATVFIGFTLSMVSFAIASLLFLRSVFPGLSVPAWLFLLVAALFVYIIILITGELIPKYLFTVSPNRVLAFFTWPLLVFHGVFYLLTGPLLYFARKFQFNWSENEGARDDNHLFSRLDIDQLFGEDETTPGEPAAHVEKEVILFRNALDFSKVRLREIMVPRNEIEVLDINSDVETLRHKFVETGFSRILFYEGNKDNIVGYVHTSAIFQKAREIKPFMKSVLIVPETMAANQLLSRFIREHRSIALVVDEFGGTAGLVTSEDILEEIFGEIEDEHDINDFSGRKINDKSFILPGRMEIEDLNEAYHLNIPESDQYETLAGFILYNYESIPQPNSVITIGQMSFKILKATLTRIEMVHLTFSG